MGNCTKTIKKQALRRSAATQMYNTRSSRTIQRRYIATVWYRYRNLALIIATMMMIITIIIILITIWFCSQFASIHRWFLFTASVVYYLCSIGISINLGTCILRRSELVKIEQVPTFRSRLSPRSFPCFFFRLFFTEQLGRFGRSNYARVAICSNRVPPS